MKPRNSTDDQVRFSGAVRHYHRSGPRPQKSWDEWVDAKSARAAGSRNWVKIIAIFVAVLALTGIITGLIIELR